MIEPVLAAEDPGAAAETFLLSGWKLESETPAAGDAVAVSLEGNQLLLVSAENCSIKRSDKGHFGAGVMLNLSVPGGSLERLHHQHHLMNPSPIFTREDGLSAFEVVIQGFRFSITEEV